jgi:hypothetical protein
MPNDASVALKLSQQDGCRGNGGRPEEGARNGILAAGLALVEDDDGVVARRDRVGDIGAIVTGTPLD